MNKIILVLDDECEYLDAVANFFGLLGYRVITTDLPEKALDIIRDEQPDIVFFDYKMSQMDGDSFFAKAQALNKLSRYILVTAYRDESVISKLKGLGISDVVMKPVDLNALLERVEALRGG